MKVGPATGRFTTATPTFSVGSEFDFKAVTNEDGVDYMPTLIDPNDAFAREFKKIKGDPATWYKRNAEYTDVAPSGTGMSMLAFLTPQKKSY